MRVHTFIVLDLESGGIEYEEGYDYSGPVIQCDRALVRQAEAAQKQAGQVGAEYGATASQIQAGLIPRLTTLATSPPGFGMDLPTMETAAAATTAATTGAEAEKSGLRAMRTGNIAALGAEQVAEAGEAARAGGSALQNILAKNAAMKLQQQEQANRMLTGLTGQDIGAQMHAMGLVPEDIRTAAEAQQVGWFQNMTNLIRAIRGGGGGGGGGASFAPGVVSSPPDVSAIVPQTSAYGMDVPLGGSIPR